MPTQEYTEAVSDNGKLLFIQEISNWLYAQPEDIPKSAILTYLIDKAGELYAEA